MGGGQAVRHGSLEPVFVGSNPTRPAFSSNFRSSGEKIRGHAVLESYLERNNTRSTPTVLFRNGVSLVKNRS